MNILVLGLGNILLTDEGVGVHAVEAFVDGYAVPDGVEVVDGGTSGMDMLDLMSGRDHIVVVDAVNTGDPPGTVIRLEGDAVPAFFQARISPHQLGLSDVLASLALLGEAPAGITLLGVVPEDLDIRVGLSPRMTEKRDELVGLLADTLAGLGAPPTPKPRAAE